MGFEYGWVGELDKYVLRSKVNMYEGGEGGRNETVKGLAFI